MKTGRLVVSLLAPLALSLAFAGEAGAGGACVYVKNESLQCLDRITSASSCSRKAPKSQGEFHEGATCKGIGHGVSWGLATPPPPPAKPSFDAVSYSMKAPKDVPAIPSPFEREKKRKLKF